MSVGSSCEGTIKLACSFRLSTASGGGRFKKVRRTCGMGALCGSASKASVRYFWKPTLRSSITSGANRLKRLPQSGKFGASDGACGRSWLWSILNSL